MKAPEMNAIHSENAKSYTILAAQIAFLKFLAEQRGHDLEAKKEFADLNSYLTDLKNVGDKVGEERICSVFDFAVKNNMDYVPPALRDAVFIEKEVRVPCGVIDRVVTLSDGSSVVVEIKGPGSRRDHACGLGQVLVYSAAIKETAKDVKMLLCCGGARDQWVEAACKAAGVEYWFLPNGAVQSICDYSAAVRNGYAEMRK